MCGISLIITATGLHPDLNRIKLMNGALRHRGPDSAGYLSLGFSTGAHMLSPHRPLFEAALAGRPKLKPRVSA